MSDIKAETEKWWCDYLNRQTKAMGLQFYPSMTDADNDPPMGVVRVSEAEEVIPRSGVYKVDECQILVISTIDHSTSDQHKAAVQKVGFLIDAAPMQEDTTRILIRGRGPKTQTRGTDEDADKCADIFTFPMGVAARSYEGNPDS